uniref:V-SNARE coiled-coil homology domain-containing protein n=1 Tax=Arcella intermedia TaxID=1963864 RepID=A0A6B2LIR9_9EUKA
MLYCAVADDYIQAEYINASIGNFRQVATKIIDSLPRNREGRNTYLFDGYNYHCMVQKGVVFLVSSKPEFGVRVPFGFLDDISLLWFERYANEPETTAAFSRSEFGRTLKQKMEFYSSTAADKLKSINAQLEIVKAQMKENLEKVMERGDSIQNIVDKTESLQTDSFQFRSSATTLKKKMWWQNVKFKIILGIIIFLCLVSDVGLM